MATNSEGKVITVPAADAVGPFTQLAGLLYDGTGALVISSGPINNFVNGKPVDINGALVCTVLP